MIRSAFWKRSAILWTASVLALVLATVAESTPVDLRLDIRQVDGSGRSYPVSSTLRLGFEGDCLLVRNDGVDPFPMSGISHLSYYMLDAAGVGPVASGHSDRTPHLSQNSPNPFTLDTQVRFRLPRAGHARLRILSVDGKLVRTLIDGEMGTGEHAVCWDGMDGEGRSASTGVFFLRLDGPGVEDSRRMILLR